MRKTRKYIKKFSKKSKKHKNSKFNKKYKNKRITKKNRSHKGGVRPSTAPPSRSMKVDVRMPRIPPELLIANPNILGMSIEELKKQLKQLNKEILELQAKMNEINESNEISKEFQIKQMMVTLMNLKETKIALEKYIREKEGEQGE